MARPPNSPVHPPSSPVRPSPVPSAPVPSADSYTLVASITNTGEHYLSISAPATHLASLLSFSFMLGVVRNTVNQLELIIQQWICVHC